MGFRSQRCGVPYWTCTYSFYVTGCRPEYENDSNRLIPQRGEQLGHGWQGDDNNFSENNFSMTGIDMTKGMTRCPNNSFRCKSSNVLKIYDAIKNCCNVFQKISFLGTITLWKSAATRQLLETLKSTKMSAAAKTFITVEHERILVLK